MLSVGHTVGNDLENKLKYKSKNSFINETPGIENRDPKNLI